MNLVKTDNITNNIYIYARRYRETEAILAALKSRDASTVERLAECFVIATVSQQLY